MSEFQNNMDMPSEKINNISHQKHNTHASHQKRMVCLITGSSRGLGKTVALAFGKRRHKVVVHYKERREEAEGVASQIKDALIVQADIRDLRSVEILVDKVINKWGRIDLLLNNAGITKEALLIKTTEKDFDDVINTNLKGPFNLIRTVGPHMIKQQSGHIINISSFAGIKGREGLSAYSASKAGLVGLTKTAAREFGGYNIMVNALLPGYMMTDMGSESAGRAKERALMESIVKDYSDPDNVAEFICYLSGTSGITGQVFNLDSRML